MTKLILAASIYFFWCLYFVVIQFENVFLQVLMAILLALSTVLILGKDKLIAQFKLLMPFIGMLIVVYAAFILLGIDPSGEGALSYWVSYGLPRALVLINALLAFRLCFALISVDDLLHSDINIHKLKYLILGKILYNAALNSYPQMKQWQEYIPSMRGKVPNLHERFKRALSITLGVVLFILAEAEINGERIDNLLQNCHGDSGPVPPEGLGQNPRK